MMLLPRPEPCESRAWQHSLVILINLYSWAMTSKDSKKATEGKGRPTPKRKDAVRKVSSLAPVVTKDQKRAAKLQARADRGAARAAYLRGDESALPLRDRGASRKYVRNLVDSRRSTGEYFLPIIFVVLVLTLIPLPAVQIGAIALMYAMLLVAVVDGIFLAKKIKRSVAVKFPGTPTKGLGMYAWLRSTQMRRLRAPHPQVKIGDKVN